MTSFSEHRKLAEQERNRRNQPASRGGSTSKTNLFDTIDYSPSYSDSDSCSSSSDSGSSSCDD
jgi:hypothetical protein